METYKITAVPRDVRGKGAMRKLRAQGLIPSNIYGTGEENLIFSLKERDLTKLMLLEYENILLEIKIGDNELPAIIKDLQEDVVTGKPVHVDFQHVQMGKVLKVAIPVHLNGDSQGVKEGGIIEHFLRDINIECLPKDIPGEFAIDVSNLGIGDSIHVKDIEIQEGIRIIDSLHTVICSVVLPAKAVEEVPEEVEEEELAEGEERTEEGKVEKDSTPEK